MVVLCTSAYTNEDPNVTNHFETFPFPLSDFQKYAIQSIVEGNHILVTAHTGSGKHFPPNLPLNIL